MGGGGAVKKIPFFCSFICDHLTTRPKLINTLQEAAISLASVLSDENVLNNIKLKS